MNRARTEREIERGSARARRAPEARFAIVRTKSASSPTDGDMHRHGATESTEGEVEEDPRTSSDLGSREGDINTEGRVRRRASQRATKPRRFGDGKRSSKRLPPVLYRRYDDRSRTKKRLRDRRRRPTERARRATCRLPPQLFHRLRREPLLDQCPSCNRHHLLRSPPASACGVGRREVDGRLAANVIALRAAQASESRNGRRDSDRLPSRYARRTCAGAIELAPLKSCPAVQARRTPNDAGFCPVDGTVQLQSLRAWCRWGRSDDPRVGTRLCRSLRDSPRRR